MQDQLFIARIPTEFPSEQLLELLASVGEVKNFHRPIKRSTGKPETYAFVTLASEELARLVIERLNNHVLDEKHQPLVVKLADDRDTPANVFVTQLPPDVSDAEIVSLFETVGTVKNFRRPKRKSGEIEKYGFLTMEDPDDVAKAIEQLDGHVFGEGIPPLIVKIATERPKKEEPPAKKEKGGYEQMALEIAKQLGETETKPAILIRRILQKCGVEQTQAWIEETMKIEAEGGMMVERLNRRRTTGGVFFYIAKENMSAELVQEIFPKHNWAKKKKAAGEGQAQPAAPAEPEPNDPPFNWEQRVAEIGGMFDESGKTSSVKVVVVGRPDSVKINVNEVTLTVQRNFQLTHIPRGVPRPPAFNTITTVYVPLKMWNKVQEALKDPEDRLVVEGFVAIEPNKPGFSVYGTLVTTANLQRARFAKPDSPQEQG
jgi:hypothetical protein